MRRQARLNMDRSTGWLRLECLDLTCWHLFQTKKHFGHRDHPVPAVGVGAVATQGKYTSLTSSGFPNIQASRTRQITHRRF